MRIHELTADDCAHVLSRTTLGRLGCARFDQPYVVPIHFSFDQARNCVYALSAVGQKIEWMRDNPKVCLEIEDVTDKEHWTTVLVTGRYREIERTPEDAEVRERAARLFERRSEWWLPAAGRLQSQEHHDLVLYRVDIDRITGRRAARHRD